MRGQIVARPHEYRKKASVIRRGSVLVVVALAVLFAGHAAYAQQAVELQEFDIPSQPLASALNRYGDVTKREALYDPRVVSSRQSGQVRGSFTQEEALQRLLAGTGLAARFIADNSFIVVRSSLSKQSVEHVQAREQYYGLVQASLLSALCKSEKARPGRYRIVAMLWIDPAGRLVRSLRIGSAGNTGTDGDIDATLRGIKFAEAPPAGLSQPLSVLIVPQSAGSTPPCAAGPLQMEATP